MNDFLCECINKTKSLRSSFLFSEEMEDYEEKNEENEVANSFVKALSYLELACCEFKTALSQFKGKE